MELIRNKYILTIVCDKNDADYLTKVTELDSVATEYFEPSLFLKTVQVLKKLVGGYVIDTFGRLGEDDIKVLYDFDTYGQDADWISRCVKPIGQYSILDNVRDWDSCVVDLFPQDTENLSWRNAADELNECRKVTSVNLIWIDGSGMAWNV